jgi:D-ribose pyranase
MIIMLKGGILNPQIAKVFAETGHMDTIVVSDAGLPMPEGVERIDLAWKPNEPGYIEVLEEVLKHDDLLPVYFTHNNLTLLKKILDFLHGCNNFFQIANCSLVFIFCSSVC